MVGRVEVTVDIILHATEDARVFYDSALEILGIDRDKFVVQELTGHFENPITVLKARTTGDGAAKSIRYISSGLSPQDKMEILGSLADRVNGSGLHIRIDKQGFALRRLALGGQDAVKLRIHAPVYRRSETLKTYEDLLGFGPPAGPHRDGTAPSGLRLD